MDDASTLASATSQRATPAMIGRLNAPASAKAVLLGLTRIEGGQLFVTLPDGRVWEFGDGAGDRADLAIKDFRFAKRVIARGDIGFAEGLMAREWDSADLGKLLTILANNIERFSRLFAGGIVGRVLGMWRHLTRENSREGARKNILAHYDLGNAFYEAWLDPSMTYSSARFDTGASELEGAQQAKYQSLADHLALQPGDQVLEIGCGWGGFAEFAAKNFGACVTGLTISDEQLAFARERVQRTGISNAVEIRRQDYRDVEGAFDKVASIEMFEAVGEKYWPDYFGKISQVLKPGGKAALQIITIRDDLFESYRQRADFIQRYIFPGGMLISVPRLREEVGKVGLAWRQIEAFGESYAETLALWGRRFLANWDEISKLGFDERFKQLWRFYLAYCEAGFRTGRTDVVQVELAKA